MNHCHPKLGFLFDREGAYAKVTSVLASNVSQLTGLPRSEGLTRLES